MQRLFAGPATKVFFSVCPSGYDDSLEKFHQLAIIGFAFLVFLLLLYNLSL